MKIRKPLLMQMVSHALREAPLECCGFLVGVGDEVEEVHEMSNALRSPVAFSIPPAELFSSFRDLRRRGKDLLGIYHSHPAKEAVPSTRDENEFHYPEVSYWIISLKNDEPVVRCFQWTGENFQRINWEVIQDLDS